VKLEAAKKLFPFAKVIEGVDKAKGGEFIMCDSDGNVVCALNVMVYRKVKPEGDETCVDIFTPDTRGVEVVHFATRGHASFHPFKYAGTDDRGMHMLAVIRRPGGVK
jgi:hypothetical protein